MRKHVQIYFLALMLMGIGFGCQTTEKEAEVPDRFEKWRVMAENSPKVTPDARPYIEEIDKDVQQKVKKLKRRYKTRRKADAPFEPSRKLPRMRLTMKMHDVPVAVLLRTLARAADVNILINETVTGQAKINITNVPWNEAFSGLLDSNGLTYKWSGDILRVITVDDLNKEIALMEAKQKYQKSKKEHVLAMEAIARKQEQLEPLMTQVVKINFADLEELRVNLEKYLQANSREAALEKAVTETGNSAAKISSCGVNFRGSIFKDTNTNSLVIHATKSDMDKIIPIIQKLDKPNLQILIEAHIVEATSDTARELGVQWGALGAKYNDGDTRYTDGVLGTSAFTVEEEEDDDGNTYDVTKVISSVIQDGTSVASEGGLSFGLMTQKIGEWALYTELNALQQEGKINILSKPSITTLDHHKAIIKSGKEVPFQTVEDDEVEIEWRDAVICLEVTPHVINDNIVRLEIKTNKDELDFSTEVDGNPTIVTKYAETMVNLFNGQTTVIGGLNKENIEDSKSGVPGLMDVPGLGWMFKNTNASAEMEELLIFITPHILKGQLVPPVPVASAQEPETPAAATQEAE